MCEINPSTNCRMKYHHLSFEERFVIEKLYCAGSSVRSIAEFLTRSVNTIAREIRRNNVHGAYDASKTQVVCHSLESQAAVPEGGSERLSHHHCGKEIG